MIYKEGFSRHRILAVVTIIMIFAVFLTRLPATKAGFVIASWQYPDQYGQGIEEIRLYQWLDSAWEGHPDTTFGWGPNAPSETFWIEADGALAIVFRCWLNGTLTGVSSLAEGQNYLRHSVLVKSPYDASIFTQQNFTYVSGTDSLAPMYFYIYNVTLPISPEHGVTYTAVVDFEIWY